MSGTGLGGYDIRVEVSASQLLSVVPNLPPILQFAQQTQWYVPDPFSAGQIVATLNLGPRTRIDVRDRVAALGDGRSVRNVVHLLLEYGSIEVAFAGRPDAPPPISLLNPLLWLTLYFTHENTRFGSRPRIRLRLGQDALDPVSVRITDAQSYPLRSAAVDTRLYAAGLPYHSVQMALRDALLGMIPEGGFPILEIPSTRPWPLPLRDATARLPSLDIRDIVISGLPSSGRAELQPSIAAFVMTDVGVALRRPIDLLSAHDSALPTLGPGGAAPPQAAVVAGNDVVLTLVRRFLLDPRAVPSAPVADGGRVIATAPVVLGFVPGDFAPPEVAALSLLRPVHVWFHSAQPLWERRASVDYAAVDRVLADARATLDTANVPAEMLGGTRGLADSARHLLDDDLNEHRRTLAAAITAATRWIDSMQYGLPANPEDPAAWDRALNAARRTGTPYWAVAGEPWTHWNAARTFMTRMLDTLRANSNQYSTAEAVLQAWVSMTDAPTVRDGRMRAGFVLQPTWARGAGLQFLLLLIHVEASVSVVGEATLDRTDGPTTIGANVTIELGRTSVRLGILSAFVIGIVMAVLFVVTLGTGSAAIAVGAVVLFTILAGLWVVSATDALHGALEPQVRDISLGSDPIQLPAELRNLLRQVSPSTATIDDLVVTSVRRDVPQAPVVLQGVDRSLAVRFGIDLDTGRVTTAQPAQLAVNMLATEPAFDPEVDLSVGLTDAGELYLDAHSPARFSDLGSRAFADVLLDDVSASDFELVGIPASALPRIEERASRNSVPVWGVVTSRGARGKMVAYVSMGGVVLSWAIWESAPASLVIDVRERVTSRVNVGTDGFVRTDAIGRRWALTAVPHNLVAPVSFQWHLDGRVVSGRGELRPSAGSESAVQFTVDGASLFLEAGPGVRVDLEVMVRAMDARAVPRIQHRRLRSDGIMMSLVMPNGLAVDTAPAAIAEPPSILDPGSVLARELRLVPGLTEATMPPVDVDRRGRRPF